MKKKIIASIVAVIVILCGILFIYNPFAPKYDGSIDVKIVNLKGKTVNEKEIAFNDGDKLQTLLEENFDHVEISDGFLSSIDELTTPEDYSTYICIYVDGEMSDVGLTQIKYKDGTEIEFRDTENTYAQ